jgi:hypothetical protein
MAAHRSRNTVLLLLSLALVGLVPASGAAQESPHCRIVCAPSFSVVPVVITSHILGHPRVRLLPDGAEQSLPSKTNFELIGNVTIPTAVQRLALYASFQWLPTAKARANPFTEYRASQLGEDVRANYPSISLGAQVTALDRKQTRGWLGLTPYVADLYSNAARPTDSGDYTHKLDLGLIGSVGVLNWLPPEHAWLRSVTAVLILDYVATGLPKAGDEVPQGQRVFLTGGRGASLLAGISIPVAQPPKP